METVTDFIFLGCKIMADCDCSHEIRRHLLLGRKAMTNLDSVLKSRDNTWLTTVYISKAMVLPSSPVWICELDHKEGWELKNWCFQRRSKLSILKEIEPEYSLEERMLKLKPQYFGHPMWRANSLEKILMLGKTERSWDQHHWHSYGTSFWLWLEPHHQFSWISNWQTTDHGTSWVLLLCEPIPYTKCLGR